MRQVKCTLPQGGTIEVRTPTFARVIVGGDVIDLDRVIAPGVTYADALDHHLEAFELVLDPNAIALVNRAPAGPAAGEE